MPGVDENLVRAAVQALYTYIEKDRDDGAAQLFDDAATIYLNLALKKTPAKGSNKPIAVAIPHSLYADTSICVITKDPKQETKDKLDTITGDFTEINEVLSVTELRKNYSRFKDKRELVESHDLFLADDRVTRLLPPLLGAKFFNKKKQPIPVELKKKGEALLKELTKARDATYMYISTGPSLSIKIAKSSFSKTQTAANIVEGIKNAVQKVPQKWKNIQAIHIRTEDSVALPVYNSLPSTATAKTDPSNTPTPTKPDPKATTPETKTKKQVALSKKRKAPEDEASTAAVGGAKKKSKVSKKLAMASAPTSAPASSTPKKKVSKKGSKKGSRKATAKA